MDDGRATPPTLLHADAEGREPPLSPPFDRRPRILKRGELFALLDAHGDIDPESDPGSGLYLRDTRRLSRLRLTLGGAAPVLLSSTVALETGALKADLTNPDIETAAGVLVRRDTVHVGRTKFLWDEGCHERIGVRNFGDAPLEVDLDLSFDADFADIFEVRGVPRSGRGAVRAEVLSPQEVRYGYAAEDGLARETRLRFHPAPSSLAPRRARWRLTLPPGAAASLFVEVDCAGRGPRPGPALGFFRHLRSARGPARAVRARVARIDTSDTVADEAFARARADLTMLTTDTPRGPYPYAGVPWFSTAFGRDGLFTAWLMLWSDPALAAGVLRFLAAEQARGDDPATDAEPGKILHESRGGELANLGVVPFRHYYGTIDATPLFVALAGAYLERTGDLATIRALAPALWRALDWTRQHGDRDGDGLLEYARRREDGLVNQGWKDSDDSVFHADGRLAEGPIALVEVQGYALAAFRAGAVIAEALGETGRARDCHAAAEAMAERIEDTFWDDGLNFPALALDGEKRRCAVRASNAGHLLFAGAVPETRAREIARQLAGPAFFSGYGVRTLAAGQARYNPMSYHNGSVWPHDTAVIGLGLARYGDTAAAARLFDGLIEAAAAMDLRRLPELFCGFRRARGVGPTLYPVACAPQAWAAAAPFGLAAAALGLSIDAARGTVRLERPTLPDRMEELRISHLRVGAGTVSLRIGRAAGTVSVDVPERDGAVQVDVML